jgi:hypothetical protein
MAIVLVMTLHSKLLARSQGFLTSFNGAMVVSPHSSICYVVACTPQFYLLTKANTCAIIPYKATSLLC